MFNPIYRSNDYYVQYDVTAPSSTTGERGAATGLILNIRLALSDGGAAIHSSLNKSASELSGAPGSYACVFEGSDIDTYLAGLHRVHVVVETGVGDILCSNLVAVRTVRRAG